jgi:predicted small integral membrane protein
MLILRATQVAAALIPAVIGFLSLLNNLTLFSATVSHVISPLISMHGQSTQLWRALPESYSVPIYIIMLVLESLIALLALIGIILMTKNFTCLPGFETAKVWVYLPLAEIGFWLGKVKSFLIFKKTA